MRKTTKEAVGVASLRLKNWTHSVYIRGKNDAKEVELRRRFSIWKNVQERRTKHINVWVEAASTIGALLAIALAGSLVFPTLAGIVNIIFEEASPDTIPSISQQGLTALIFVSAALGAFIVWFTADASKTGRTTIRWVGKLFLFSALSFSLFMLLSPLLPDIVSSTQPYYVYLKWVTVLSLMAGSTAFGFADVLGLVYLWRF